MPLWVLIGLNLLLFMATEIIKRVDPEFFYEFVLFLGLIPAIILERPWAIITSMFLHSGVWHILANMLTLYFFGRYLCVLIGEKKFLLIYFVGGIVAGIFYILLGPSYTPAIGASGAVFALGGTLAVMRPRLRVFVFPIPVPLPLWAAIIGVFLVLSFFPNVAWQAHLGGLLFGLVTGYFLRKRAQFY